MPIVMKRSLPPLNSLKAFESAARCLSFSRAAEELCVTQGAVSKQVQQLEQYLDQVLFERLSTGIRLSSAGERYFPVISQSLDAIGSVTSQLKQTARKASVVSLEVTPSFSSLWLIPRLTKFSSSHADIHLEISSGDGHVNSRELNADIAVRCLPIGSYADTHLLVKEQLCLLAGREQQASAPLFSLEDLGQQTLLPHLTRPQLWQKLLAEQFLHAPSELHFGTGFEHFYMTLEAVQHGVGIGLVPDFMAMAGLCQGQLINPMNTRFDSGYGYYLVIPEYKAAIQKNARVKQWLQAQFTQPVD